MPEVKNLDASNTIHNEHAQKSHSRTRGVANFGNVTRTEGAKHKKK